LNLLAFDTSTEQLSIALSVSAGGVARVTGHRGAGGAQASATLIPAIQQLLAGAGLDLRDLDAIAFGRGPGSFTGLRTACSVAQGLAFGSGVPVLPIDTLLAVAEEAHACTGATRVVAVLDARMGEVYAASYEFDGERWHERDGAALLKPHGVVVPAGWTLAGNAKGALAGLLADGTAIVEALPEAAALLRLAPEALAAGRATSAAEAMPLYIRDKVAQTTEERAAARAAAAPTP
jgi:tRNA threonylcarbamoyladenosine biosynthesis protein TsaB